MPKSKGDTIRGIMAKTKNRAKAIDKYNPVNIDVLPCLWVLYVCVVCFSPFLYPGNVTSPTPLDPPPRSVLCEERVPCKTDLNEFDNFLS